MNLPSSKASARATRRLSLGSSAWSPAMLRLAGNFVATSQSAEDAMQDAGPGVQPERKAAPPVKGQAVVDRYSRW